jgi:HPt (histidine-containing phosphotransfer) domain-containing protein
LSGAARRGAALTPQRAGADSSCDVPKETLAEQPIDWDRLREVSLDDEEFAQELIGLFLDDGQVQIGRLRAALEAGVPEEIGAVAHRLKGSASNVGATALAAASASLERAARAGEAPPAAADDVEGAFALACQALRRRLAVPPNIQDAAPEGLPS